MLRGGMKQATICKSSRNLFLKHTPSRDLNPIVPELFTAGHWTTEPQAKHEAWQSCTARFLNMRRFVASAPKLNSNAWISETCTLVLPDCLWTRQPQQQSGAAMSRPGWPWTRKDSKTPSAPHMARKGARLLPPAPAEQRLRPPRQTLGPGTQKLESGFVQCSFAK